MPAPVPIQLGVGEKVEVVGGSHRWLPGTVTEATEQHYVVRFDAPPPLASQWEGRPRRIDGVIKEVKIHRSGFEGNSIRRKRL